MSGSDEIIYHSAEDRIHSRISDGSEEFQNKMKGGKVKGGVKIRRCSSIQYFSLKK